MKATSPDTPARVTETPPEDRFCDLVLNGGVASGVVYPWALVELARHWRFRNIGGNSVGAMAAALAAAAEYGRCHGVADAFEPLRRLPLQLAEEQAPGVTKMLSLFQPAPALRRLFRLFVALTSSPDECSPRRPPGLLSETLAAYRLVPVALGLLTVALLALFALVPPEPSAAIWVSLLLLVLLSVLGAAAGTLFVFGCRLWRDLKVLARNGYGLCSGQRTEPGGEGLVEWLHRGIQLSAGRGRDEPPLTFADLWSAPRFGRAGPAPMAGGLQPADPGIDLQMFTSNVTQGRPVRLPLNDANTRLYYLRSEWEAFFPPQLLDALEAASTPYVPASGSDPDPQRLSPALSPGQAKVHQDRMEKLLELPSGGMPIVIAARLSLSFPVLFACVPVWAVDYEEKRGERVLRRCLLSDGGLCTNFPVHLFDAACPRWPTFAMLLDRRLTAHNGQAVWLPKAEQQGRGDNWQRNVPGAEDDGRPPVGPLKGLGGLLFGMLMTMKDWNDRVTGRLPQVRNRMVRMALRPGEGQLHIAMPGCRILKMAKEYGVQAAKLLNGDYLPGADGTPSPSWRQHLYVRMMVELRALRRHLRQYTLGVRSGGATIPLRELLRQARERRMLLLGKDGQADAALRGELTADQAAAIERAVTAVETLEHELAACDSALKCYDGKLEPELRLRPPV